MKSRRSSIKGYVRLEDVAILSISYIGVAMAMHTICGNLYKTYSIAKRVFKHMRTVIG